MRIFDGVEDLVQTCREQVTECKLKNLTAGINHPDFVGRLFTTREEIYEAACSPWDEGVAIIDRMTRELESVDLPKPQSRRRPRFREDDGDELDYDRLRSGQPFWRQCQRESTRGPQTVTIVIDVNANAKIKHEDIMWRGAAAIAMTKILEDADFRVELWIVHCAGNVYNDKTGHCHAVCLKRAGDPLDIATFAAAVSGWFYRSLMHTAKAIGRLAPRAKPRGGTPRRPYLNEIEEITHDPKAILISGVYDEWGAVITAKIALRELAGIKDPPPSPEPEPEPLPDAEPAKPPNMKSTNMPELSQIVRRKNRDG